MAKKLKQITKPELLAMLDDSGQAQVQKHSGLRGALAFVVFQNKAKDSPEFGRRTVIPVGDAYNYKTVAELHGSWLGEGEQRQDAVSYYLQAL